jgi:hypothetical protein
MISRRIFMVVTFTTTTAAALVMAACSSSSGSSSSSSGGTSGTVYVDSGAGTDSNTADTSPPVDSGIAPGSVALAMGPCTQDKDCAPSPRGTVGCFMGGMGGGAGDGGGGSSDAGPSAYCSLKCSPTGMANTTTCAAPFLEFCNMRGYCKLH